MEKVEVFDKCFDDFVDVDGKSINELDKFQIYFQMNTPCLQATGSFDSISNSMNSSSPK